MKRDENGLIEGVKYVLNDDGSVNWRAMIAPKYLVPNKDRFPDLSPEELKELDVTKLEDSQLLIKLDGIKALARLRGYTKVQQHVDYVSDDKAVNTCTITWIPNIDTAGVEQTFSDTANATTRNCSDFGVLFLEPIAANRAFVRSVRNYLGIEIVGADEISSSKEKLHNPEEDRPTDINEKVKELCEKAGWGFETLKEKASAKYEVESWNSWSDIPKRDAIKLVSSLKRILKKA